MKYHKKAFLFFLFSTVFLSCDRDKSWDKKKAPQKGQEEIIKQALIDMWDAIETGDMERYASFIHPEFTQFGETDSLLRVGKEAELNGIRSWLKNSSDIHTEMVDPVVTVNGNVAWIVYYWKDQGTTNGEPFSTRGKSTRIFVKENDHWLCIHGHYTLLP
jgi:ketosteroid isomerase-like protein